MDGDSACSDGRLLSWCTLCLTVKVYMHIFFFWRVTSDPSPPCQPPVSHRVPSQYCIGSVLQEWVCECVWVCVGVSGCLCTNKQPGFKTMYKWPLFLY